MARAVRSSSTRPIEDLSVFGAGHCSLHDIKAAVLLWTRCLECMARFWSPGIMVACLRVRRIFNKEMPTRCSPRAEAAFHGPCPHGWFEGEHAILSHPCAALLSRRRLAKLVHLKCMPRDAICFLASIFILMHLVLDSWSQLAACSREMVCLL